MCIWRNSTFELETFAPSILHKLAIIEVPIHSLAAYVVLVKTPSRMESVKWMMFTMHICGAYLDLFLSALSTQFFLLPAAAGHSQGLYTYLGIPVKWQAYMFISAICLAGVSILGFFESRYNALVKGKGTSVLKDKKRLFYIGVHYIYAFVFILPITFTPPDQVYGMWYVRQMLPCVPQEVFNHPDFFIYAIDITLLTWIIGIAAFVITTLNNISLNMMAFHGLISSAVMLTVHKPYRQAVMKMFCYTYIYKTLHRASVHTEGTIVVLSSNRA
ncbi:unnamed protein product [Caenorhabditis brenneri]